MSCAYAAPFSPALVYSVTSPQYNRMTEQQERLREAALAGMKARSEALGDIATRDKLAAKKRAEDEDARLVSIAPCPFALCPLPLGPCLLPSSPRTLAHAAVGCVSTPLCAPVVSFD